MEAVAHAPSSDERPWKRALAWLAFLGPFFFASYGLANWAAGQRASVGAIVFEWERHIPFLAWTIVPYWSIDLLYGLSLFVCATRSELDTHAKRLLGAQVIAIACFLFFPLRFTFDKPVADGVYGLMFDVLGSFDQPYNQAPSLHIALLVILWVLYAAHVKGAWRWVLHTWFALVGASILTTWQHHFIDLPTGIWVGWLCVWLFPMNETSLVSRARVAGDPQRRRLAARYALAATATGGIALALSGWALWLMWAAGALALVACIYLLFDESAFQKRPDGSLSPASRWLLAPYLAGAWLNSRWWTRTAPLVAQVAPGLMLGRIPTRSERESLGVKAVIDLTAELPLHGCNVHYACVPQLDLVPPTVDQLARAARAIDEALANGPTLVCCALGFSRSAAAVAAWLLVSGRAHAVDEAIAQVRQARAGVVFGAAHIEALEQLARKKSWPS